mgnify:CR=1 FL=1
MADSAICVNPNDPRFKHLRGKKAIIPLIDRAIPVIEDEYVAMDFGTGCLKVTPAHDMNDYELGKKHQLEVIDILNEDGTLNEKAKLFIGEDRFIARKKIAKELEANGFMEKVEGYQTNVGYSERTDAVIEPRLSLQWFLEMKHITKPALENVLNDEVKLIPPKFKNTYRHWMENVRDWCISRQLWWGHRIPAWYDESGNYVVAKTHEEAVETYKQKYPDSTASSLQQDPESWFWQSQSVPKVLDIAGKDTANEGLPRTSSVGSPDDRSPEALRRRPHDLGHLVGPVAHSAPLDVGWSTPSLRPNGGRGQPPARPHHAVVAAHRRQGVPAHGRSRRPPRHRTTAPDSHIFWSASSPEPGACAVWIAPSSPTGWPRLASPSRTSTTTS